MPVFIEKKIGETPKEIIDRYKKENKDVIKASYAGRLDPMANGLMILLINNECKQQDKYLKLNKIDTDFWGGESKVKLKILTNDKEALISLNETFRIDLNSENLDNLRSIFGENKIKLS